MDISGSSDDDENTVANGKTRSKPAVKKSAKSEQSSMESDEVFAQHLVKKKDMKKATVNGRSPTRSKKSSIRRKPPKKTVQAGLDGNYWNDVQSDRHANAAVFDYKQFADDDGASLLSSNSSPSDDDEDLLYKNKTFVTCRSPSDSFYLCELLQNVYTYTKKINIRWYSVVGEDGDDTTININTHFILDYDDTLDRNAILISIPNVIHHPDDTISLKKQDIVETKRLLAQSIRGESVSSDNMMDLSTEYNPKKKTTKPKISYHIHFQSNDESDSSSSSPALTTCIPESKKRKKISPIRKKSRKQPPAKKRARKTSDTSGEATPIQKRRQTEDITEISDTEDEPVKSKKKTKKPAKVSKTQLFKVHSNRLLQENLAVTKYQKEPFFEDNLTVPFISSFVQSKLAIRAVIINDPKLLKSLISDVNRVCSVHVKRSLHNDLSAIHYAIKNDNIQMLKILLDDVKSPKKNRCPFPTVAMTTQSTGRANIHTFGFRTAPIMASRGVKEGNNALNKDEMNSLEIDDDGTEIISYALENNCSRQIYDLLFKIFTDSHETIYNNIHKILEAGHHKLAASIIGDIKDNAFHGFNYLHHQVLLYDNEDITINRAASVIKKTKMNCLITPIHCAAINPNSKYLKQLLNIMPEYNILDKNERRPIHFAAACEGPEPLEYLISKQVNFNDVDRSGNSPLHVAVKNGRAINAEILLRTAKEKAETNEAEDETIHDKFGLASINRVNKARFYPLHLAVLHNHLDCVKVLLEYEANVDILTSTSSGKLTPLMLACQKGYLNIVTYLIDHGAKIEARDRFKRTPLIHACMCGNADIVSYLLRLGANANVFDSSLNTALHYSIAYGWYFCVRSLLEAGANLNCVNSWQTTCLAAGFLKGHYGLCDYLLTEHNVDINFKTDDGLTLVMLTIGLEISSSAVEQLVYVVTKHKADCASVDANGSNAFHYLAVNTSVQDSQNMEDDEKKNLRDNLFKMAKILRNNKCDPNQMNNKAQSPLMIALEIENFILVDYLINKAKIKINSDISHDGKTLLHYFAMKCEKYDLIQALLKLPITDEIKKMGQILDNNGRTPFHYCVEKFDKFCQQNQSSTGTDELKNEYQSIVQMIEYCLESAQCDPDIEITSTTKLKTPNEEQSDAEEEEEEEEISNENSHQMDDMLTTDNEKSDLTLKETSILSLLRTVSFIDPTIKHPLESFLKKTKNPNILHHKTQRTPLLESIYLQQTQTILMLINNSSCNINLSTSIVSNERQQTPLIFACKLQLLSVIRSLLEHEQCDISTYDYENNQAIHYYLQTSTRSREYLDILNIFIKKLQLITNNGINNPGKYQRTPLHIAVYHNLSLIDAINDVEQVLIENGSDLLMKDNLGNIPLHNVFLNKKIGDDPVELCVLIAKAMKYKSLDTKNNEGDTPLHLAVAKCSTVCIMLLQQHNASLLIENNLSNSIIGTCIASGHLNLFITFLQQSIDIDLGKLHSLPINDSSSKANEENSLNTNIFSGGMRRKRKLASRIFNSISQQKLTEKKEAKSSKQNAQDIWKWKYLEIKNAKKFNQHTLLYLIIERDWQGALSLILNDLNRFHLSYMQIIEGAILNNKLNLVLRLLLQSENPTILHEINSRQQNFFHLIANINQYDEYVFTQILSYFNQNDFNWNTVDQYGTYPLHYACVKQNFLFIHFLLEKHSNQFNLNQTDTFGHTPIALLFWSLGHKTSFSNEKIRLLIASGKQLDSLCNYNNEIAIDPLSFGYIPLSNEDIPYPSVKSDDDSKRIRTSPLIHAIVHNNFQLVKFLLELNADVNYPDENQQTPLIHAVRQNNIEIVKLLLNKTYSPDDNETPKDQPKRRRKQKFFLGNTTITDTDTDEPAKQKSKKFQRTSLIDLNATDTLGRTCIHHLVQPFPDGSYINNIEILRLLHSFGASLTISDHSGSTPLQYSIENNCQHLCNELTQLINHKTHSIKAKIEPFYINDPNKQLLDKPDFYNDAQELIDEYISSPSPSKHDTAYKVDQLSGMSLTGEVLMDTDKNEPYDVRLTKTDVNYGTHGLYNFYRMQIIKHKSKNNLYFLFTRWGRIGDDEGQHQLTPYSTFDECRNEFSKVFREKTGNLWKDTDQFEAKPKKYTLIRLNEHKMQKHSNVPIDFDRLQAEHKHPSSQLQSSIYKSLMRTLMDRQAMRNSIDKTQLDIEWMPVSQLKCETLEKAHGLLIKIKESIKKKEEFNSENQHSKTSDQKNELKSIFESIHQYTNEYYSLIPLNGYSEEKLSIIDNHELLKQQQKILDDLFELELSYKMLLGAQANLNHSSPLDYLYKSMNCQFQALNKDDLDSQLILRYIWNSSPVTKVEQIFKIARPNEDERLAKCNLDNHYLLWHGTSICNLISILTRGLLAGSMVATATGSLFGTGIYTADSFAKSLGYCSGVQQNDGERCFMLLCEVALGNIKELGIRGDEDEDYDKPFDFKQFQSRKGVGRQIPDPKHTITRNYGAQLPLGRLIENKDFVGNYYGLNYNEYIVYDEAQIALRYLVQFRR